MRKLANSGQAILCTIHQPSGILFEIFDRVLFLKDGHSVYFGDIGPNSRTLIDYFYQHGARACGIEENPSEWLLDITNSRPAANNSVDWPEIWQNCRERQNVKDDLEIMKQKLLHSIAGAPDKSSKGKYASKFAYQLYQVTRRNLEHDWRSPAYLYSKVFLTAGAVRVIPKLPSKLLIIRAGSCKWIFIL